MNLARDLFASMITTPSLKRQINLVATTFAVGLLIIAFRTDIGLSFYHLSAELSAVASEGSNATLSALHNRKLLHRSATGVVEPHRIWGEKCSKSDIVITQGPTAPLPNGIPTYTVEIVNACVTGCDISGIHLSCGWFSSARLINPRIFKRLRYGDCLVNDGQPLVNGRSISFQYANTFLYPLSVSSVVC